jgi:pilus assembly protein Flp/PilA
MKNLFGRFVKDESGATAIEYGLIAAGIALAIIAVVNGLGSNLQAKFTAINTSLKYASVDPLTSRPRVNPGPFFFPCPVALPHAYCSGRAGFGKTAANSRSCRGRLASGNHMRGLDARACVPRLSNRRRSAGILIFRLFIYRR